MLERLLELKNQLRQEKDRFMLKSILGYRKEMSSAYINVAESIAFLLVIAAMFVFIMWVGGWVAVAFLAGLIGGGIIIVAISILLGIIIVNAMKNAKEN